MSGKKKSGSKKPTVEKFLLATAILNFIKAMIDLINRLME